MRKTILFILLIAGCGSENTYGESELLSKLTAAVQLSCNYEVTTTQNEIVTSKIYYALLKGFNPLDINIWSCRDLSQEEMQLNIDQSSSEQTDYSDLYDFYQADKICRKNHNWSYNGNDILIHCYTFSQGNTYVSNGSSALPLLPNQQLPRFFYTYD